MMNQNLKYILFDWDGCMADTLSVWLKSYQWVYAKYGLEVTIEDIVKHSWGNLEQGPNNLGLKDYDKVWEEIVAEVQRGMQEVSLHENVYETIKQLDAYGYKLAIVTASLRKLVEGPIKNTGLDEFIDVIITEDDVSKPKPDPEIIYKAIETLNGDLSQAMIIGDTAKDINAGKAAGIKTTLTLHPVNERFYDFEILRQSNPDNIIEQFDQLLNVLKAETNSLK